MIGTLHIKNIGIIDEISVELSEGFNVITGETGAGKSSIIDSLNIISGGRFSKEMIRRGQEYSFIELNLFCPNNEKAIDGSIIVSREININGKNSCKINGRLATVNELKEFMSKVIDIHGQHENQLILNENEHIEYLDAFIEDKIQEKVEYKTLYQNYKSLQKELKENYGDDKEKERKLDLLRYELNEINAANLKIEEEKELEEQSKIMQNSEKLQNSLNNIDIELNENAVTSISNSIRSLEKIEDCGAEYQNKLSELKDVYYTIQELARDISYMKEEIYFDEEERSNIENRLDTIYSLKRKYGNSIEEILEYRDKIEKEIDEIENKDEYNNKLKEKKEKIKKEMLKIAQNMHKIRLSYAEKLSTLINKELEALEMKNAKFSVSVELNSEEKFNSNGLDKVIFLIQTNVGDEFKSLTKIASGGEMSRIMLAIKTVLSDVDKIPVLVFDEIDTGISGKAAKAVGEKMKLISKKHQVICITHLATIAAKGDSNYYVSKNVVKQATVTDIRKLKENEIIEEIAKMTNGEVTETSKKHAMELRLANVG